MKVLSGLISMNPPRMSKPTLVETSSGGGKCDPDFKLQGPCRDRHDEIVQKSAKFVLS